MPVACTCRDIALDCDLFDMHARLDFGGFGTGFSGLILFSSLLDESFFLKYNPLALGKC